VPAGLAPHNEPHARRCCVSQRHRRARVGIHREPTECASRCRGALNKSPRPSFCE
jgi:hypothetical protein